jgi:hypothetical protein
MNGNPNINFYTTVAGHNLTAQTFGYPLLSTLTVPLYYSSANGGAYTIALHDYYNPDSTLSIELVDDSTGSVTNLNTTTAVSATLASGSNNQRNSVVFRIASTSAITGISNLKQTSEWKAFNYDGVLQVSFTNSSSLYVDIHIFNTMGLEITNSLHNATNIVKTFGTSGFNKGIYIVNVVFENGKVESRKVIVD